MRTTATGIHGEKIQRIGRCQGKDALATQQCD